MDGAARRRLTEHVFDVLTRKPRPAPAQDKSDALGSSTQVARTESVQRVPLRLTNALLRVLSLVAKLGLTLYMGRYLGLSELGTYGLVAAWVAIGIPLLGLRLDYVVARDIVTLEPAALVLRLRDQALFYALNYCLLLVLLGLALLLGAFRQDGQIVFFAACLCILENVATVTSANLVSLGRPVLANCLFFLRAAAWALPVIVLGLFLPQLRSATTVFIGWLLGLCLSLVITAYQWRHLPWALARRTSVNWAWIRGAVKVCSLVWLGAVGAALSINIDRFVVDANLGRSFVGIVSFYGSFTVAISSLLYSGIFAFGFPRLVQLHQDSSVAAFRKEALRLTSQAVIAAASISIVVGVTVPWLGVAFHRPEFRLHAPTLWLILLAITLKSATESLYYVMYARHQDRAVWLGNLLLLAMAAVGNVVLVPRLGFAGIGYSALISAVFIGVWRIIHTYRHAIPQLMQEESL